MIRPFGINEFLTIVYATQWTLLLSLVALVGGALGGMVIALLRTSSFRVGRNFASAFIVTFQGTPLLMQLFLVFFGASVLGFNINPWIAAAIGATFGGFICDFLCRRHGMRKGCAGPAVTALVLSGIFLFIGAISGNAYLAVGCLALSFLANQTTEAAYWAAAISIGGRNAAAACGVMNTGGNSAAFINALLVQSTASVFGWTAAMVTGTVFAFIAAILWLFIRADQTATD